MTDQRPVNNSVMIKIAVLPYLEKIHYYYISGRTREVRDIVLNYLNPSQRKWLTKRPWKVIINNQGRIELYAKMGKFVTVEEESKAVTILFATEGVL